ncbi:MAG: tetratricopeptide repeat protein [Gemmatimonadota bacterium]
MADGPHGYRTDDVARLLDVPVHRVRAWARAGFVSPARGPRNELRFSFQDLVLLRTAAELARGRIPQRRITRTLLKLQRELPHGRSLTELHIHVAGDEVVVRDHGEPAWNPSSGQFHIDFDTADIASRIAEIAPATARAEARGAAAVDRFAAATGERADPDGRTAGDWFELAVELEGAAPAEARRAYGRALALDASLADARVNLGRLLHDAGLIADAEAAYRRVLAAVEHALAAYNLAVLLEDAGRSTEAIQAYARALAADPLLAEAHYNLARLYEQQGDERAAIRHLNGYRELMKGR